MISDIGARIRENSWAPNQAAAKILFQLANEEHEYSEEHYVDDDSDFESIPPTNGNMDPGVTLEQTDTNNTDNNNFGFSACGRTVSSGPHLGSQSTSIVVSKSSFKPLTHLVTVLVS